MPQTQATAPATSSVDAEIHRKALENIVNEMAITLVRTSGSPIVTDAMDFSTCLLDANGDQLSLAAYILAHSASSMIGTKAVIADLAANDETAEPGDSWLVSDPYEGGAMHQGDVAVITPMFHEGEIVAWAFANMHLLDVGGSGVSGIAPGARSVYEEGVRFPPVRAIRKGRLDRGWEKYIRANVRAPAPVINDIVSMVAATNVAQVKVTQVIERFGLKSFRAHCETNKDLTEALFRKRIEAIPDGTYEAVDFIEYDGQDADELLEVRGTMVVEGSDLKFSFQGDPQISAYVNATVAAVHANVMVILLTTLAYGDLPFNAGMWRPVSIDVGPPGTVVNATNPAPVSTSHADGGARLGKVVKNMLVQALSLSEDPVLRGRVSGVASDGCATAGLFGQDDDGNLVVLYYMDPGAGIGGPAVTVGDGQDAYGMAMMPGCGIPDVELHESTDPVLFLWRKIAPNSGGPGQLRGGQGMDLAYYIRDADQLTGFFSTICAETPPAGAGGGLAPSGSTQFPVRQTDALELMEKGVQPTAETLGGTDEQTKNKDGSVTFRRADVLRVINGGGSGLGDPLLRPADQVARDVRAGYITAAHAKGAYGVVLAGDGGVDAPATEAAREEIRRGRIGGEPKAELKQPADVGIAVRLDRSGDGAAWACASCEERLAGAEEDWRETGTVVAEHGIEEHFAALGMWVVGRETEPKVKVREHYCPSCAACLASDVAPEGVRFRSPRLSAGAGA
jgi:N-methylhydantoinase B